MKKIHALFASGFLLLAACGDSPVLVPSSVSSGYVPISEASVSIVAESGEDFTSSSTPTKASSSAPAASSSVPSSTSSALPSNIVRVTIPEGYSLDQIGAKLEEGKICSKAAFLSTINSYDFSYYDLVAAIPSNPDRYYKLEGYLFPNTYEFYKNSKPQDVIGKMLRSTESKIGENYSYPGMTTYEIITLASIIEKEGNNSAEMAKISSVFHNRLKSGMKLQSDPTINYVENYIKPYLSTENKDRYSKYYNTYKCAALPVGPICNPGTAALKAACNPADTDYLYFAADKQGNFYYASTYKEHVANCNANGIEIHDDQVTSQ